MSTFTIIKNIIHLSLNGSVSSRKNNPILSNYLINKISESLLLDSWFRVKSDSTALSLSFYINKVYKKGSRKENVVSTKGDLQLLNRLMTIAISLMRYTSVG